MTNPDNPYNRTDIAPGRWIVLCRADSRETAWFETCSRLPASEKGKYLLATSSGFETREDAQHYANGISPSREPLIAQIPG